HAESSATVRGRVAQARTRARGRLKHTPWQLNAHVPGAWYRNHTRVYVPHVLTRLEQLLDHGHMSLRGVDRVLRLAWTVADLAGNDTPTLEDVATAVTLRSGGEHDF